MIKNIKDKKTLDFIIIKKRNNKRIGTIAFDKITKFNAEWGRWISQGNTIENIEFGNFTNNFGLKN